jgi:hypothetical protein
MTLGARSLTLTLALAAALTAGAAAAAGGTTYSGTVVAIDPREGVLVLDEVGPWRVEQGRTVLTRRTVHLTAETKFSSFIRVTVPGAFAGDFLEVELAADSVTPGDFATVECVQERGRLVALRVTLAEVQ